MIADSTTTPVRWNLVGTGSLDSNGLGLGHRIGLLLPEPMNVASILCILRGCTKTLLVNTVSRMSSRR